MIEFLLALAFVFGTLLGISFLCLVGYAVANHIREAVNTHAAERKRVTEETAARQRRIRSGESYGKWR